MAKYINVHCHLFNYQFIPDSFFAAQAPVREWMLKNPLSKQAIGFLVETFGRGMYKKLPYALSLLNQPISEVADTLISEMDDAGIALATPLMMDLEIPSKSQPEVPYLHQIELISDLTLRYNGRLLPFVMVDPRRSDPLKILRFALEEMGFLGLKIYPPLGVNPYPKSLYNQSFSKLEDKLNQIYAYCEENQIPITAHCTMKGAYSNELIRCKELSDYLASPVHWRKCLNDFPKLRLNLAHYGGDFHCQNEPHNWSKIIDQMLLSDKYPNLYVDMGYQQMAFDKKYRQGFFKSLEEHMSQEPFSSRILFGTDWPMTRHSWSEKDYINYFKENLSEEAFNKMTWDNPIAFLFPEGKIPERIINCYQRRHHQIDERFLQMLKC